MATELENSIKRAAETVAKYVEDVATLTVETCYVEVGGSADNFEQAKPGARTIIKLDADSQTVIPMQKSGTAGLEVDTALLAVHDKNVASAIEYRARMLSALIAILQGRK